MHQETPPDRGAQQSALPSWLVPVLAAGAIGIGLVFAGVISATTLIYAGAIGGMLFMHLGHGGHSGHGSQAFVSAEPNDASDTTPNAGTHSGSHSCH
jgi:hypothetical protein